MQKRWKIIIYQKLLLVYIIVSVWRILWPWSHISCKWVSKKFCCSMSKYTTWQLKYYIEEIHTKSDGKRIKSYNVSKIIIALYYWYLSANSPAMIIQFL